jgi:hypothetical protein
VNIFVLRAGYAALFAWGVMLNSATPEDIIGIVFSYLMLGILCTALREGIKELLNARVILRIRNTRISARSQHT